MLQLEGTHSVLRNFSSLGFSYFVTPPPSWRPGRWTGWLDDARSWSLQLVSRFMTWQRGIHKWEFKWVHMAKQSESEPRIHRNFLRCQCRAAKTCWIETVRENPKSVCWLWRWRKGAIFQGGGALLEAGRGETTGSLQKFYKIKHFCRYFDFNPLVCTIEFCS